MSFENLKALIEQRRSIHYFTDESISEEVIGQLLNVAHLAPSVENTQPWEFHVITNLEMKKELMQASCYGNFISGASVFIVGTCRRSHATMQAKEPVWNPKELEYSCVAAMENMMLAATAMGLGTCWVSLHHGPVHNILHLKDGTVVIGGLMIGHLKKGEDQQGDGHVRGPIDQHVVYHR